MNSQQDIKAFLEHLWLEKGLSENTRLSYQQDLKHWLLWLDKEKPDTDPKEATSDNIRNYLTYRMEQGYKPKSTARLISSLRGFYRYLLRKSLVTDDITAHIERPQQGLSLPKSLDEQDVEALLQAPDTNTPLGTRDRCMLELLYACGLRVSELVSLTTDNINIRQGVIRIIGKGSKERLIPMGEDATQWLEHYIQSTRPLLLKDNSSNALFPGRNDNPMTRQTFWHRVKYHAVSAGITSEVSPHTLRHAFATHLVNHGADLRVVQLLLGHSNLSTTQIYTHIAKHRLSELHAKHHPRG